MDYNLDALSDRQFERLSQALVHKYVGPSVSVFGDGPDGGREATWRGPIQPLTPGSSWNGYGVLQAKKSEHPSQKPVDNEKWFLRTAKQELENWSLPDTKRLEKPEYLIFATNVRISPSPGAGIDRVMTTLHEYVEELELPIQGIKVWHYDDIQVMLDRDNKLYTSIAAWVTPGDLIARLVKDGLAFEANFSAALRAHAAKSLIDDHYLNLTQAGNVADKPISVADVFIDLPIEGNLWQARELGERGRRDKRIAETLIVRANTDSQDLRRSGDGASRQLRSVLVGGPGQGKSTVTQFLAQVYRAEFIRESTSARTPEVASILSSLDSRLDQLGIERPSGRRWPVRVILTELADALQRGECNSLLGFIARSLSRRTDVPIDIEAMRSWLRQFPWILFIDGLDEVPASSNRTAVLAAISDFEIEVATAEADVCTVATTRPQGYNDEFSPDHHRHFTLARLPEHIAMEYAEGLVRIRSGRDTEASRLTMARLKRATQDETTSRLFASPLQVTILTVLIERVGQVPRDRWRLFSDYYRVIYQREQEKGGELADLLREFEADVHYIHREIGYTLQARSAIAGETSSYMTKKEFDDCIRKRLTDQQHDDLEVERLSQDFSRLVVERLVFLAVVQSGNVGFELRSIQEFMAGEFVTNQPEVEVIPRIKQIAPYSHWRNAVLFAFGRIFAEKDPLKAEAVQVLEQLNWELEDAQVRMIGSHIALDILLDGSCHSQPRYARPLAERACVLFDGPLLEREGDFSRFRDGHVGQIIRNRAVVLSSENVSHQLNRFMVLARLATQGGVPAQDELTKALQQSQPLVIAAATRLARFRADASLARAVEPFLPELDSSALFNNELPSELVELVPHEPPEGAPAWLEAVQSLDHLGDTSGPLMPIGDGEQVQVSMHFIRSGSADWSILGGRGNLEGNNWGVLNAIAEFTADPSEVTLAAALELAAGSLDQALLEYAPWPLAACFWSAVNRALVLGEPAARDEWLRTLANEARKGSLGDTKIWEANEKFVENAPTLRQLAEMSKQGASDRFGEWGLPVAPNPHGELASMLGLHFYFSFPRTKEAVDETLSTITLLLDNLSSEVVGDQYLSRQNLAFFLASLLARTWEGQKGRAEEDGQIIGEYQVRDLTHQLSEYVLGSGIQQGLESIHLGWLALFHGRRADYRIVLNATCSVRRIARMADVLEWDSESCRVLISLMDNKCAAYRLLAHFNIKSFYGFVNAQSDGLPIDGCDCSDRDTESHSRFNSFMRLATASKYDARHGVFDNDILGICRTEFSRDVSHTHDLESVDADLLRSLLESMGQVGISLSARCALVLAPTSPLIAYSFKIITERLVLLGDEVEAK